MNKKKTSTQLIAAFILIVAMASASYAQTDAEAAELAKQAQNPVASLISIPFQFNFNLGMGEYNRSQTALNIQPVVPVSITSNINLINRFILPVVNQPDLTGESGGTFGLGNLNYTAFFTPAKPGAIIWGVGPALSIPTSTAPELGGKDFGIGPSIVVLTMPGPWALGFVANQIWSYKEGSNLNSFFIQYFITYNLSKGWFLSSAPSISANWKAADGEKWTVPFGLSFGKVTHLGRQPIKVSLGGYYNAIKPTHGPDWTIQFQLILLFPKKI
jgi:hypothetical protein